MKRRNEMNEFDTRNLRNPSPYTKILDEENKNKRAEASKRRKSRLSTTKGSNYADSTVHIFYKNKGVAVAAIALFILPVLFLGLYSAMDTDATVSETEKRNLKTMPEFSFQALFSGTFTKDFEEYYSDTFPFRDFFLNVNKKLTEPFTQNQSGDGISIVQKPNENDQLGGEADILVPTENTTEASVQETETKPTDNAENHEYQQSGYIILDHTRKAAMELYTADSRMKDYSAVINSFAKKVPDSQVYVLLAPTSLEFYSAEKYHTGNKSEKKGISMAYDALSSNIKTVDAYSKIQAHTDEYIYFRTDHHWTARGAYYGYTAFAETAGLTPKPLSSYQNGKIEGFVGSYYGYTQSEMLKENPDYVEYFLPQTQATGVYSYDAAMTNQIPLAIVRTQVENSNKYLAFIQGDTPVAKITTGNKNGKKIMVVKESYGNAFVPFLIENYEEIYVTDPRKIDMDLPKFIKEHGIQDVLMINYVFAPYNKGYMDSLKKMVGYNG